MLNKQREKIHKTKEIIQKNNYLPNVNFKGGFFKKKSKKTTIITSNIEKNRWREFTKLQKNKTIVYCLLVFIKKNYLTFYLTKK